MVIENEDVHAMHMSYVRYLSYNHATKIILKQYEEAAGHTAFQVISDKFSDTHTISEIEEKN